MSELTVAAACVVAGCGAGLAGAAALWRRIALDAAHEVRRPVAALAITAESLRDHLAAGELDAMLAEVRRADAMLDALGSPLGIRGRSSRPVVAASLADQVRSAAMAWTPVARACGRRLVLKSGLAADQCGAGVAISAALSNLIANELEHGDGDVHIDVDAAGSGIAVAVRGAPAADAAGTARPLPEARGPRGRGLRIAASSLKAAGGRLLPAAGRRGAEGFHFRNPGARA